MSNGDRTVMEDRQAQTGGQHVHAALGQLEDLARLIRSSSSGRLLDRTRTLLYLPGAQLVEVLRPGVFTTADRGWVEITSTAVRFSGPKRRVVWSLRRVQDVSAADGRLLFSTGGKGLAGGFAVAPDVLPLADLTVRTARQLNARTLRLGDFQAAVAATHARLIAALA